MFADRTTPRVGSATPVRTIGSATLVHPSEGATRRVFDGSRTRAGRLLAAVVDRVCAPGDHPDERRRVTSLVITILAIVVLSCFWVALYGTLGLWSSAAIPFAYQVVALVSLVLCMRGKRTGLLLSVQLGCWLVFPFALQWTLGGFVNGSAVMLWAIVAPLGALVFEGPRRVMWWFAGFVALTVISGLIDPALARRAPSVPDGVRLLMFVLDIGTPAAMVILLLRHFAIALHRERDKSDRLLYQMLPARVAERLRERPGPIADSVPEVTILFADLAGFTPLSQELPPEAMIELLNRVVSEFDRLAREHGVEKITTLGDGFIAVGGVPAYRPDHAEAIAELALDMQEAVERLASELGRDLRIRIGINTGGPVVAGVVGTTKYLYSIVGDAMNTASRMESHGLPGRIQVSESTYRRLNGRFSFEDRGVVEVKGKGPMRTYFLVGRPDRAARVDRLTPGDS